MLEPEGVSVGVRRIKIGTRKKIIKKESAYLLAFGMKVSCSLRDLFAFFEVVGGIGCGGITFHISSYLPSHSRVDVPLVSHLKVMGTLMDGKDTRTLR